MLRFCGLRFHDSFLKWRQSKPTSRSAIGSFESPPSINGSLHQYTGEFMGAILKSPHLLRWECLIKAIGPAVQIADFCISRQTTFRLTPFLHLHPVPWLSTTKTPQTVTLQVTILCQQISKKKQHAPEHSFALTLRRSFVTIFWQKNLTKLQLAVLPFAVF